MTLENKLRALLRTTERGKSYPEDSLSIGVQVFLKDMNTLLNPIILRTFTDNMLINNYFCWEEIMFKNQDNPPHRIAELAESLQVTIVPNMTKKQIEEEVNKTVKVVDLFAPKSKSLH